MSRYSIEWLLEKINQGEQPKFLCFWSHQPARPAAVGKQCFSQWYDSPFEIDGVLYRTAEHWMMAQKAILFGDLELFDQIVVARTPGEAKDLGRRIRNFDEALWLERRFPLVVEGNRHKFDSSASLGQFLKQTGERVLVEASPADRIWGAGLAENDPRITQVPQWSGLNLLGFALMEVRDGLNR